MLCPVNLPNEEKLAGREKLARGGLQDKEKLLSNVVRAVVRLPEEANNQVQSRIVTALMCPLNSPNKEKLAYYYTSPSPMRAVACRTRRNF